MKKSDLLFGTLMSLLLLAMTACSSDEDTFYDQDLDCKYTWLISMNNMRGVSEFTGLLSMPIQVKYSVVI